LHQNLIPSRGCGVVAVRNDGLITLFSIVEEQFCACIQKSCQTIRDTVAEDAWLKTIAAHARRCLYQTHKNHALQMQLVAFLVCRDCCSNRYRPVEHVLAIGAVQAQKQEIEAVST
jgi:hypothetical protein